MIQTRDRQVETRAIALARADNLEWVNLPRPADDGGDMPAAATNAERDSYRQKARAELDVNDGPFPTAD